MADVVCNIAKGRVVEYYNRVENNDPAASALIVVLFTGTETDDNIKDADTLAALEALALAESVDGSYARKTLTDTELAALPAPDDTNNRYEVDVPDQTWTGMTGETLTRLAICYDNDTGAGTDANIVPLTVHDFAVTTDGSDLTAQFNALGFFRAAD
jgi:hypothetical protein